MRLYDISNCTIPYQLAYKNRSLHRLLFLIFPARCYAKPWHARSGDIIKESNRVCLWLDVITPHLLTKEECKGLALLPVTLGRSPPLTKRKKKGGIISKEGNKEEQSTLGCIWSSLEER